MGQAMMLASQDAEFLRRVALYLEEHDPPPTTAEERMSLRLRVMADRIDELGSLWIGDGWWVTDPEPTE